MFASMVTGSLTEERLGSIESEPVNVTRCWTGSCWS